MFTVTMYTLAVTSIMHCSIMRQEQKLRVIKSFNEIDAMITKTFNHVLNHKTIHILSIKFSIAFWSVSITLIFVFTVSSAIVSTYMLIYALQIVFLHHLVHMQALQMVIFMNGIQSRLRIISDVLSRRKVLVDLKLTKKILIQISDVNRDLNSYFNIVLVTNIAQLYASALINFYWLAIALLGLIHFVVWISKWHFIFRGSLRHRFW